MCFIPLGSTLRAMSDTFKVISPIDQPHVSKNHLCFEFRNLTCVYMAYSNIELHSGYPSLAPLRPVVEKVHIGVLVGFFNKEGFCNVPIHVEFDPFPHRLGYKLCLIVIYLSMVNLIPFLTDLDANFASLLAWWRA